MRILIGCMVFIFLTSEAFGQWTWVHPQPCGNIPSSMTATDSMHVWATTSGGCVIYTKNGGRDWKLWQSDSNVIMLSVSFVDSLRGWVSAEHCAIYKTTDGGESWTHSTIPEYPPGDIRFTDSLNGWVGSRNTTDLRHTTDGGNTWDTVPVSIGSSLARIAFPDANHGWAGENGTCVYHTDNGGGTWGTQCSNFPPMMTKFCFPDTLTGYMLSAYDGMLHCTYNGGASWVRRVSATFSQISFYFSDRDHGWVAGFNTMPPPVYNEGRIARTTDGGKNYTNYFNTTGSSFMQDITASDSLHAWAMGSGGLILATVDGGKSWVQQGLSLGDPGQLNDIAVLKEHHMAVAVGDRGFILKTEDDGNTWEKQESHVTSTLNAVQFFDSFHGIIGGNDSRILKTSDGGEHWDTITTNVSGHFRDLYFVDILHGWATLNGDIFESKDGGLTWKFKASAAVDLVHMVFTDSLHGWALGNCPLGQGYYAELLMTKDGGSSWDSVMLSSLTSNSISFSDTLHGWICGINGVILTTTDGGSTWSRFVYNQYCDFNAVHFTDSNNGWVVGNNWVSYYQNYEGVALHTEDGGLSWTRIDAGIGVILTSVFFGDKDYGYAAGRDGSILRWGGTNVVGNPRLHEPVASMNVRAAPNPCKEQTVVRYFLAIPSSVSLKVFDVVGKEVIALKAVESSGGDHQFIVNTDKLLPGIYFCKLTDCNHTKTIKIIKD